MTRHNNLLKHLSEREAQNGAVTLGEFMQTCLTHPEHGYYISNDPLGKEGDFITAPEISQMFGEMIGAWIMSIWMQMGSPSEVNLIECGPGRGTLMDDILRIGSSNENFMNSVKVHLIEAGETLTSIQKKSLNQYNVTWSQFLNDAPLENAPCIIIGNEFLDALPIEQLKRTDKGWLQRFVSFKESNKPQYKWGKVSDEDLLSLLPNKTVSNEIYEVSPQRIEFINQCADLIKSHRGAALFIDYGYTSRHHGDTFQAVKDNQFIDPLENLGKCDLTAHVDFESLRECVKEAGLNTPPCVTQGRFLQTLGISIRAQMLKQNASERQKNDIDEALKRLTHRDQMGELFKAFCFYYGYNLTPEGF